MAGLVNGYKNSIKPFSDLSKMGEGEFPKSISLGDRAVAWVE